MSINQQISIDPAVLRRCGSDLKRVANGLGGASKRIAGATISGDAFGIINKWMVTPITTVADQSTSLIEVTDKVTSAVGTAADGSADDFEATEQAIISAVSGLESGLGTP